MQATRAGIVGDLSSVSATRARIESEIGHPTQGMLRDADLVIAWQQLDMHSVGLLRDAVVEHFAVEFGDDGFLAALDPQNGDLFAGQRVAIVLLDHECGGGARDRRQC